MILIVMAIIIIIIIIISGLKKVSKKSFCGVLVLNSAWMTSTAEGMSDVFIEFRMRRLDYCSYYCDVDTPLQKIVNRHGRA